MARVPNEALKLTWQRRIAQQRRSRLSVAKFCSQQGVSAKSFYAWRRRLREADPAPARSSLFVPVEVPAWSAPMSGIRIELPSGVVMTLPADASAELLTTAIRAVMSAASIQERPSC